MDTVHDNGRNGKQPDLRELIDQMGAVAAAVKAMEAGALAAAAEVEGVDWGASTRLQLIAGDAHDAGFYLDRALRAARGLL